MGNNAVTRAVGPGVVQLWGTTSAGGTVQVINLDDTNSVYLGNDSNISAGAPYVPYGPGDSQVFDGSLPIYAVAAEQIKVAVVPGGSSYSPGTLAISGPVTATISGPVDATVTGAVDITAGTVDVTGIGGYVAPGQIAGIYSNTGIIAVGAGQTNTLISGAPITTYASLDFSFVGLTNTSAAAGSAMCAVITFNWLDGSGNFVGTDRISVCQGQSFAGSIPCQAAQLLMTITNPGSTGILEFAAGSVTVDGSYRSVDKITFTADGYAAPSFAGLQQITPTTPAYGMNGWLVNLVNLTGLNTSDTYMLLLPMYYGEVKGNLSIATDTLSNDAVIIDLAYAVVGGVSAGAGNNGLIQNISGVIANTALDFYMPPSQCALILKASNVATSVDCSLLGLP